ncbi:MAG TPA: DUF433 domain-containing protein [Candidatus Binataceae bacterium]|nr:DUF433 domain-containing protein [Candidatus Binataceae bacterium]
MSEWHPRAFKDYRWIVADPALLGGKLAIRGTRFSVAFILACMAEGLTAAEIESTYGPLPHQAIAEVLKVAAAALDARDMAA